MATVGGPVPRRNTLSGLWRVPRSRGAVSGILLVLLGAWGGLVPFWGPQFGYAYTPATTWTFTYGRLWLEILPAVAVIVGGLGLLASANRATGLAAGWLSAVAGAWFVVGPSLSLIWAGTAGAVGSPAATSTIGRSVTEIGFFYGLGAAVVLLSATAIGRYSVIGARELREREHKRAADDAEATRVLHREPGDGH